MTGSKLNTFWIRCGFMVLCLGTGCAAQTTSVGPQYGASHVYVAPEKVDAFARCFLGTFGGTSTQKAVVTVTPTPSSTTSQILQTPSGTVSLFGFTTPIPAPFGEERTGLLVNNLDVALREAQAAGADVVVRDFPDPIGRDAIIRFPGGVMTQLYWHTKAPHYQPLAHIPENRIYVSHQMADAFLESYLRFSGGRVLHDEPDADGAEIGRKGYHFRRVEIESEFGRVRLFVTDGILPWPYGRETTGYGVDDLRATLARAVSLGAVVKVPPSADHGNSAMVLFPGGYLAEIHESGSGKH